MAKVSPKRVVRFLLEIALGLVLVTAGLCAPAWAGEAIRVGIFENKPIVYFDQGPQGLFVEVLDQVAAREGWQLEYVACELNDCLEQLASGRLDLMTSLGVSAERLDRFTFSREAVWTFWGTIYARDLKIQGILDLQGKVIGVRRENNITAALEKLLHGFNIPAHLVEFDNYEAALTAIQRAELDAIAVNNTTLVDRQGELPLHRTPIIFNPFSAYFAAPQNGRHLDKLAVIDDYVRRFKADKDSVLHRFNQKWFGAQVSPRSTRLVVGFSLGLVVLSIVGMALWRYRSLVVLNRELSASILEQQRTARELKISQDRLLEAQEIARMGRWELDLTTSQLVWSDGIYTLFEVEPGTFTPSYEGFLAFVHPQDRSLVDLAYQQSVAVRSPYALEHRLLMSDGRIKWVNEIGRTEYDSAGQPLRSIGIVQEITERKLAELALLESKERHRAIVHTALDGFWLVDGQGRILEVNQTYCRMSGYSAEELVGMTVAQLEAREGPEEIAIRIHRLRVRGEDRFETEHRRKDGSRFDVEVSLQYRPGKDDMYVVFMRDISERKQAEQERRDLQAQLIQAQKMEAIGTLAGGIAHDFNNILGAVLGYAEMARDLSPPGSAVARDLDKVMEAGQRAATLVKQILAFSRQTDTERIPLAPIHMVKEAIRLLRPTLPSTITIKQQLEASTRVINADPTQLHQIVLNLCTNAFHAMEKTGGTLAITLNDCDLSRQDLHLQPEVEPGKFVRLAIADSGPGIAPEIRTKIFEPYFTTKEVGKGTGMGLAIVHGIIRQYGGFITCDSSPGQGAVFSLYFPAIEAAQAETVLPGEQIPRGQERILFVDDEELLVDLGKLMLERLGYAVTVRTDSREALALFERQADAFDVVITDQTMPGMTGMELARRMLRIRPGVPIILCTGYSTLIDEDLAREEGIRGFAFKPLTKKDLSLLLRQVLAGGEPAVVRAAQA